MYEFCDMVKDLKQAQNRANRDFKRTKHALGTYEDGYLSALNFTLSLINKYVDIKKRELMEEIKNDNARY